MVMNACCNWANTDESSIDITEYKLYKTRMYHLKLFHDIQPDIHLGSQPSSLKGTSRGRNRSEPHPDQQRMVEAPQANWATKPLAAGSLHKKINANFPDRGCAPSIAYKNRSAAALKDSTRANTTRVT